MSVLQPISAGQCQVERISPKLTIFADLTIFCKFFTKQSTLAGKNPLKSSSYAYSSYLLLCTGSGLFCLGTTHTRDIVIMVRNSRSRWITGIVNEVTELPERIRSSNLPVKTNPIVIQIARHHSITGLMKFLGLANKVTDSKYLMH